MALDTIIEAVSPDWTEALDNAELSDTLHLVVGSDVDAYGCSSVLGVMKAGRCGLPWNLESGTGGPGGEPASRKPRVIY